MWKIDANRLFLSVSADSSPSEDNINVVNKIFLCSPYAIKRKQRIFIIKRLIYGKEFFFINISAKVFFLCYCKWLNGDIFWPFSLSFRHIQYLEKASFNQKYNMSSKTNILRLNWTPTTFNSYCIQLPNRNWLFVIVNNNNVKLVMVLAPKIT